MKQFMAFFKKELHESAATYKLHILLAVFLIFGMISPLTAKLMPDILKSFGDTGIMITLPEPSAIDAWAQFFKNVGQMGMAVIVIVFCGTMSNELSKGTLINLLTKGLNRHTVILSKFLCAGVLWAICYALCFVACYGYTAYFWGTGALGHAFLAFAAPCLFGALLIALLIFGGTLFGNVYGSLLSCLGAVVALNIVSIAPAMKKYNPIVLSGGTLALLTGELKPADFIPAVIVCCALVVMLITSAIVIFDRKKV